MVTGHEKQGTAFDPDASAHELQGREKFVPRRVLFADECVECDGCGEPFCPDCEEHYADCSCIGPAQADELGIDYSQRDNGEFWTLP